MALSFYERPCYRSLDTPLKLFGAIEVQDLFFIVSAFAGGVVVASATKSVLVLLVPALLAFALLRLRKGKKPAGYLRYFFYKTGIILPLKLLLPGICPTPYLVPPVWMLSKDGRMFLSAGAPSESDGLFQRFFLCGRRSISQEMSQCSKPR
jgi:hypothetical protein